MNYYIFRAQVFVITQIKFLFTCFLLASRTYFLLFFASSCYLSSRYGITIVIVYHHSIMFSLFFFFVKKGFERCSFSRANLHKQTLQRIVFRRKGRYTYFVVLNYLRKIPVQRVLDALISHSNFYVDFLVAMRT